jgi:hypothetical protein
VSVEPRYGAIQKDRPELRACRPPPRQQYEQQLHRIFASLVGQIHANGADDARDFPPKLRMSKFQN